MIVVDGAEHRRVRGATSHAFTPAGLNRANVGRIIEQVIEERVVRWPHMNTLPIARETRELALAVIFRMIGIPPADLPEWRHQFEELAMSAVNLPMGLSRVAREARTQRQGLARWSGARHRCRHTAQQ